MHRNKQFAIWMGILLFAFSLTIYGQAEQAEIPQSGTAKALLYGGPPDPEELALSKAGLSGLGLTFIDGDPFFRFQLQPDIDLGKVGLGLDVVLLYNPEPDPKPDGTEGDKILAEDGEEWDNISTILRVVRYVRYGHLGEPFYARFGELDYVTIGHGFIMSGYSNYDRRGLRLNLSTKTKKVGIETVINNLGDPTVFGGRVFVRPLQEEEGGTQILNSLEFGATYLTDIDPQPLVEGEDLLIALGADVGLPLINNKLLRVDLYDDVAFLNTKSKVDGSGETEIATGNAVGLGASISKALFKVEYRIFGEGFQPTIFDYTYDSAKPDFLGMNDDDDGEAKQGYFSMLAVKPISKVDFLATFEDYTTTEPKLYAGITESGLVDKLSFRAFYVKRNIGEPDKKGSEDPGFFKDLFRLDNKSAFIVRLGYEIIPRFEVAIIREYRFQQVEDIDRGTHFKPIHKTSVEAGFNLNFR
jgi:hypothetical protein